MWRLWKDSLRNGETQRQWLNAGNGAAANKEAGFDRDSRSPQGKWSVNVSREEAASSRVEQPRHESRQ
jgi:hypothetical protein